MQGASPAYVSMHLVTIVAATNSHPIRQSASSGREAKCPHCGTLLPPNGGVAALCPSCGKPVHQAASVKGEVNYEDKAVVCLPYELERVARAEAVDGWHLLDTTVSEAVPGMIEAHFRRPVYGAPPDLRPPNAPADSQASTPLPSADTKASSHRVSPSGAAPSRSTGSGPPQHTPNAPQADSHNPHPSPSPSAGTSQEATLGRTLYFALLALGLLFAAHEFGWLGFIIALWLLPQLLKGLLRAQHGAGGKRSASKRRKRRRRR